MEEVNVFNFYAGLKFARPIPLSLYRIGLSLVLLPLFSCSQAPTTVVASQAASANRAHQPLPHDMSRMVAGSGPDSNYLAQCSATVGWSKEISQAQQTAINELMRSRGHRTQHALWHATRAGIPADKVQQEIHAYGASWKSGHPLCPPPGQDDTAADYNPTGEDFLFMHHQMVGAVQEEMMTLGLPCIRPFESIPQENDWPFPDADRTGPKSPKALTVLLNWEHYFLTPGRLERLSLSQLGWALEFSIHNNLHMRFATTQPPAGFEGASQTGGAPLPLDGKFPANWQYDNPGYNWLADPYGAALNPTFWKIHGFVDQMLTRWLKANGYQTVAVDCKGNKSCYQWHGTWTGEMKMAGPDEANQRSVATVGTGMSSIDPATEVFTQKRMQHQNVGVLGDDDLLRVQPPHSQSRGIEPKSAQPKLGQGQQPVAAAAGPGAADPLTDPLAYTRLKLCAPKK
jgi:hypothetical protein